MNTLTQEQFNAIKAYWDERQKLELEISYLRINIEQCYAEMMDNDYDDYDYDDYDYNQQKLDAIIDGFNKEIEEINEKISLMDKEYEINIISYGLSLYDRNMDEKLFNFINNGFE